MATVASEADGSCKLYISKLNVDSESLITVDYSLIMGSMFFQQMDLFAHAPNNETLPYFLLWKNPNALSATYLGDKVRDVGPNPFQVEKKDITVDESQQ